MKADIEEARFLGERATPRSAQKRSAWGSMIFQAGHPSQECQRGKRCVFNNGHSQPCWPED